MTRKNNITVVIYAFNDELNIQRAVESARLLSSHVLLIDIGSTDGTPDIARRSGTKVVTVKHTPYVELVRMEGLKHVKTEWVFILDSDEVMTENLAQEINSVIIVSEAKQSPNEIAASSTTPRNDVTNFRVPRKNIFGRNKWLKHGGWWPDYQTRLIHLSSLINWSSVIHSTPQIEGESADLKEPLLHYSHGNFSQMVNKTILFEGVESDLLHAARKRATTLTFFRKFFGELYRRLIKQKGFLDGKEGCAESIYQAYSKTVTYLMLYEKNRSL